MGLPTLLLPLLLTANVPKLAVMDIRVREGVTPGLAQIVTDAVVAEIRKRARNTTVIASEDLRSLVGFETEKRKLGCQEMACLAEIGGALGVDQLVVGTLAKLGRSYLLDLRLIDARHAKVIIEANERLKGKDEEDLLDAAAQAVATLIPQQEAPPPATTARPSALPPHLEPSPTTTAAVTAAPATEFHPRPLAIALGSAGVVAGAVAVVSLVEMLSNGQRTSSPLTQTQAQAQAGTANTWATVGLITGVAAVAGLGGAVFTW